MSSLIICEGCNTTVRMGLNRKSIPLKWARISWTEREVLRGSLREVGRGTVDLCEDCRALDLETVLLSVQATLEAIEGENPEHEKEALEEERKRQTTFYRRRAVAVRTRREKPWEIDLPADTPASVKPKKKKVKK